MIGLSDAIKRVKPSPTVAAGMRAAQLKAAGRDIVSLTVGEPDLDTPQHVKDAATEAMKKGFTRYTAIGGIMPLKTSLVAKFENDQGVKFSTDDIIVTNGGKQALAALCSVLLNPGDEVVIPAPYWTSYPDMVELAGGKPVIVETGPLKGYLVSGEDIAAAVTAKTKAIILNYPSNPTGACYTAEQLKQIGTAIRALPNGRDITIIADEVYEYITYSKEGHQSLITVCPELREQTVVVNAFSKAYSMTGWRVGYAAGPTHIINALVTHQSQFTTNVCSIAQHAAAAAYTDGYAFPKMMKEKFIERMKVVVGAVETMPGIELPVVPQGAFYGFLRIEKLLGKSNGDVTIRSAQDFSNYLLDKYDVAVVSGEAFGDARAFRISYALNTAELEKGLERIKKAAESLG